ncbi:catechol 2,3-dioxygenase-like lactoylglutathione lyase family enzyme [Saccharomonospora amisosensis]|uniref:Catechol 2,3-dioxygenase-like lactoylglutathione lyase family enzyme n=1 Tax=Saccharomonospora amisosensis TaxID=1128677 RepID=A0A7X5UUV6_9PSEU|nr:VOC family protein [Saccharomonospora amisosensis]NIJ14702.1 catechol 2,3-dioxygenase-like lactoylglutathione lyase family enzyme [Saccharomonospora amisosensis]
MTAAKTSIKWGCVAIDCPQPWELARFYGELLGWQPHEDDKPDDDWVTLVNPGSGADIAFQRDPEFRPPTWPSPERAQMLHLDFEVSDIEAEHERVLALGARLLDDKPTSFRVYADPAGHPFCLCAC